MINVNAKITGDVKRNLDYADVTRDAKANVLYYWDEIEDLTFRYLTDVLGMGFTNPEFDPEEITIDDVKELTELVTNGLAERKNVEYPIVDGYF